MTFSPQSLGFCSFLPSSWNIVSCVFFRFGLLGINNTLFLITGSFPTPPIMVYYLVQYFTLSWPSWSVKTLNELLQALLAFKASDKKWAVILTGFPLFMSCVFSHSLQYTFSTAKHTPRCVYYLFFETEHRKILLTWAHLGMVPSYMVMLEYDPMWFFFV